MPIIRKNIANFTGTLMQSRAKPGTKYAFLLFRSDNTLRFCLCEDVAIVRSLEIGETYQVNGREYTAKHETYLQIHSVQLVRQKKAFLKSHAALVGSTVALFVVLGLGGIGLTMRDDVERSKQQPKPAETVTTEVKVETTDPKAPITDILSQQAANSTAPKDTNGNATAPSNKAASRSASPIAQPAAPVTSQPADTEPAVRTPDEITPIDNDTGDEEMGNAANTGSDESAPPAADGADSEPEELVGG